MTQSYAYQVLGLAVAMSAIAMVSVVVASRIYDRNTRRIEARGKTD